MSRRWARARRWLAAGLVASPGLLLLAFDVTRRGKVMATFPAMAWGGYLAAWLVGSTLWGALLVLASRRRGWGRHAAGLAAAVGAFVLLGGQRYFFGQYAAYGNQDAVFFGVSFLDSVRRLLIADGPALLRAHALPGLVALALLAAGRLVVRPRRAEVRAARALAATALLAATLAPWSFRGMQACTPDVLYLHALGGLVRARAGLAPAVAMALPTARTPEFLPAMTARPARPRNLIFILTESVRHDAVCSAPSPSCPGAPFSNAAAPERIPFLQLRANDSATTVSVAVTLTGVAPQASHDEMHRAPSLWEIGRAAGYDTAYWTSQDLRGTHSDMFVREIGARLQASGYDLDPLCDTDLGADDTRLTEHVARELGSLREPFVAVVHYANTHFPYLVDKDKTPFQPSEETKDPEKNGAYFNYYRNAVYLQDETLGELIGAIRRHPVGERTVVVYTSDHGEAFREHGQLAHSLSIYDEEVRVPGWLDAPPAALTDAERSALSALRDTPVWQIDLLPTFLDLMGLWDAPELARARARMAGASLLRPLPDERVVPLTNCTAVWGCPFRNWGVMRGPLKLEARAWDPDWHCFHVLDDPFEQRNLGVAACGDLPRHALRFFGARPGDRE